MLTLSESGRKGQRYRIQHKCHTLFCETHHIAEASDSVSVGGQAICLLSRFQQSATHLYVIQQFRILANTSLVTAAASKHRIQMLRNKDEQMRHTIAEDIRVVGKSD